MGNGGVVNVGVVLIVGVVVVVVGVLVVLDDDDVKLFVRKI